MQQSMVKYTLRRCKQGPENHTNKAISILSSCVNEHARKRKTCEKNLQICRAAGSHLSWWIFHQCMFCYCPLWLFLFCWVKTRYIVYLIVGATQYDYIIPSSVLLQFLDATKLWLMILYYKMYLPILHARRQTGTHWITGCIWLI